MKGDTNILSNVDIFSEILPFVKIVWKFFEKVHLPSAGADDELPIFMMKRGRSKAADHDVPPF